MCEYCDCQAVTTIDELAREHDLVVNLIGDVRRAQAVGDLPQLAESARCIAAVLSPHTKVEEHGLFPALAGDFPEHLAGLEAETVASSPCSPKRPTLPRPTRPWPRLLAEVLDMLREHILNIQQREVVYSLHLGLIRGVLDEVRAPLHASRLDPLVEPTRCLAHISARDERPHQSTTEQPASLPG